MKVSCQTRGKKQKTSQAHLFNLAPSKSTREGKCHATPRLFT